MANTRFKGAVRPDASSFEAFVGAEGDTAGVVAWLRNTATHGQLKVGMWQCEVSDFSYLFAVDETFLMVEGVLRVELEDGRSWDFGPGDTASFLKGTRSHWYVLEPVLHFFIQTDAND